jgi:hypothetical protein
MVPEVLMANDWRTVQETQESHKTGASKTRIALRPAFLA